jgi:short-subunit dehydrogenase
MPTRLNQSHVVVTGASEGIGRAVALEAARRGARLTLAARSAEKLEALRQEIAAAGSEAEAIRTDVTREDDCRNLMSAAAARFGGIDILVANAGVGSASQTGVEATDPASVRHFMEVNFMGAVHTTHAALPYLKASAGLIAAISSLQGLIGFPVSPGYAASKHAMQGFFNSLRINLAGQVRVLVVSPGPVDTAIHVKGASAAAPPPAQRMARASMPVETCARLICDAVEAGRRDCIMTAPGKLAHWLYPFVPDFVDGRTARAVQQFYGRES